ncbi:MAG: alpha/beta hydrolase [Nocardioides sp.]
MPVDPELAGPLAFIRERGYPPMSEGTPETARKAARAMSVGTVTPEQVVQVGKVEDRTVPGAEDERPARVYRPATDGPHPTVVFFHGGGFVVGDLDTHDQTCRRLCADAEAVVLSVDYRLAPEHPFPAGVEDALAATRWAFDHLAELGGTDRLGVAGDSAGGNFTAVVSQALPELVDAQLLIYPATDAFGDYASRLENAEHYFLELADMTWFHRHYTGGAEIDTGDVRFSPYRATTLEGQPPAVVATAEYDPLRDEGEAYAARLAAEGIPVDVVRYDGLIHGFVDMGPWSAAAAAAVTDLNGRFAELLHSG